MKPKTSVLTAVVVLGVSMVLAGCPHPRHHRPHIPHPHRHLQSLLPLNSTAPLLSQFDTQKSGKGLSVLPASRRQI